MPAESAITTTQLRVRGMSCASCVNHVERNLLRTPGVHAASVNLATETARVEHDPALAATASLLEAVSNAGYAAEVLDDRPADLRHADPHHHDHAAGDPARWRLIAGAVLAIPVVVLGMTWMDPRSAWVQLAFTTPILALLGRPFYRGAWKALRHARADMDTLVALGTSIAFLYSLVVTIQGGRHVYFDTAVVILVLIGLGKWLEARARSSAAAAIRGLMDLQPPQAILLRHGEELVVPVGQL